MREVRHEGIDGQWLDKAAIVLTDDAINVTDDGIYYGRHRLTAKGMVPINGYNKINAVAKMILQYNGRFYKFIGWNSDRGDVFFVETEEVAKIHNNALAVKRKNFELTKALQALVDCLEDDCRPSLAAAKLQAKALL